MKPPGASKTHPVPGSLRPRVKSSTPCDENATYHVPVLGRRRLFVVSGRREARIGAVAAQQRGRITRRQLLAIGVADRAIYRLVASGYLRREHCGVYAVGHTAPASLAEETAALLACRDGAVLSHFTAARLWKILLRGDSVHVTVPGQHAPRLRGVHVHKTKWLAPGAVCFVDHLPVSSPARTLHDIASGLSRRELERAVDEAIQLGLVQQRVLLHVGGRLAQAAARHSASKGVTRSELERRFRRLIDDAGLPQPRSNVRLHGYEVDFYWPAHGLVVEVDGYQWHRTRPKFEHDAAKGAALVAGGLALIRFTWRQMEDRPLAVAARLAQAIARADAARAA